MRVRGEVLGAAGWVSVCLTARIEYEALIHEHGTAVVGGVDVAVFRRASRRIDQQRDNALETRSDRQNQENRRRG